MNEKRKLEPGSSVRLRSDPGRIGVLTNRGREIGGVLYYLVQFPDISQWIAEDQLDPAEGNLDALDLLRKGRLGRCADFRRNLTHVRLSGRLANLIYSMETTNTDFYPYQFKPVLKFLESPGGGILIADEVGLGKTIEAGLIWTELRSRVDARRLMVLCPAMLREKWELELRTRFGIKADILNARELLSKLKASLEEGESASFAYIGSIQGLRPDRNWGKRTEKEESSPASKLAEFLDEHANDAPLVDLLIIDEAHYMRNWETMSAELGRLFRRVAEQVVLLSATPIHLRSRDLYQLVNLVDEDTFNQPSVFDSILEANAPLVRARDRVIEGTRDPEEIIELLKQAKEHPYLAENRQIMGILEDPPTTESLGNRDYRSELAYRLETINLLSSVVARTRKREVTEWRVLREAVPEKIVLTQVERDFYDRVTNLVREFAERYQSSEGFLLVMPQRQMASCMPAALREWQRRSGDFDSQIYEDIGDGDYDFPQPGPLVQEILSRVHELGDLKTLWENDSKFHRLLHMIRSHLKEYPDEKIVLFSYFRPTLKYLNQRLSQEGIRTTVLMGQDHVDRGALLRAFASPEGPNVLLSSEVASEGIDLQFSRIIINYDLPWNPMRVEQRIGRIDRLGQKASKILIWNLFAEDTIDARIYDRLYLRLGIFERALGGLESVLGEEIRKLTIDLLSRKLTPEQEIARIEQTAQALVNIRKQEERLEEESATLMAHGDYIINQVKAARELNRWISGKDIYIYVRDFLERNYPGCELRQLPGEELLFEVNLSNQARSDLGDFLQRTRASQFTRLARSTPGPTTCRFQNRVASPRPGREEVVSQFHPLVRFVSSRIESARGSFYPTVSIRLAHDQVPGTGNGVYAFAVQRWFMQGIQDRERLHFAVRPIDDSGSPLGDEDAEKLVTTAAVEGQDWLEAANAIDLVRAAKCVEDCLSASYARYERHIRQVQNENNDRADIQETALRRHLKSQLAKLEEVRATHERRGRDSLVKATEGRMAALRNRIEMRLLEIGRRRELKHRCEELCMGVILVEGE